MLSLSQGDACLVGPLCPESPMSRHIAALPGGWRMAEEASQAMVSLWRSMEYRTFGKPYVTGRHFDSALISGVL